MDSRYYSRSTLEGYLIGATALAGITLVACAVPCYFGLRLSKQNDISRSCVPWIKAAICLFAREYPNLCPTNTMLSTSILTICSTAIVQATEEALNMSNFETGGTLHLFEAAQYIATVASFLTNLASLSLFIVFAHVGTDILHMHYGAHDRPNPIYRYITYVIAAVLAAIAAAGLGLDCNLEHWIINGGVQKMRYSESIVHQLYTAGRLSLAFVIIGLLASVANLVYAIIVSVSTKATYSGTVSDRHGTPHLIWTKLTPFSRLCTLSSVASCFLSIGSTVLSFVRITRTPMGSLEDNDLFTFLSCGTFSPSGRSSLTTYCCQLWVTKEPMDCGQNRTTSPRSARHFNGTCIDSMN